MEAMLNEYKDAVKSSSRRLYRCIFTGFDI